MENALQQELLTSYFPANSIQSMSDMDKYIVLSMDIQIEEVAGQIVAKRKGEIVRDAATKAPVPVKQAVENYFVERNWIAKEPGVDVNELNTASKFEQHWLRQNPDGNLISPEYINALNKHSKQVSGFDIYK